MSKNLTAADVVFALSVTDLFPIPFIVERFSMSNPFSNSKIALAETRQTLDGKLERGYVYNTISTTVTLEPTSATRPIITQWASASSTTQSAYSCNGNITFPSLQENYTLTNGVLIDADVLLSAAKITSPMSFTIQWEGYTVLALPA